MRGTKKEATWQKLHVASELSVLSSWQPETPSWALSPTNCKELKSVHQPCEVGRGSLASEEPTAQAEATAVA